jgi:hypothetical protein
VRSSDARSSTVLRACLVRSCGDRLTGTREHVMLPELHPKPLEAAVTVQKVVYFGRLSHGPIIAKCY